MGEGRLKTNLPSLIRPDTRDVVKLGYNWTVSLEHYQILKEAAEAYAEVYLKKVSQNEWLNVTTGMKIDTLTLVKFMLKAEMII